MDKYTSTKITEAVASAVSAMDASQLRALVTDAYVEVRENSRRLVAA